MYGPESPRRASRGMSLVELMVAIVVGLLVTLAALASSQLFMGRQRQALDVGSASSSALTGLSALQYELSHAGMGFYANGALLCPALNLSVGATALKTNEAFPPLAVTVAGGVTTLDVRYASALEAGAPATLQSPTTSGAGSAAVASYLPVVVGQQVMLVPAAGSTQPCTVRSATAVTAATGTTPMSITLGSSGANNQLAFSASYTTDDSVALLGSLQWSTFSLSGTDLTMTRPLAGNATVAIAHNVMAFRVDYGVGDGVSSTLTGWQSPTGAWASLDAAHLARLRAVRIGLVVRNDLPEKKDAAGHCSATAAAPQLFDSAVTLTDPDWACYRYRVDTLVVPLRNFIWGTAG